MQRTRIQKRRDERIREYEQRERDRDRERAVYQGKSGLNAANGRTTSIYNSEQESESGEIINHQSSAEEINRTRIRRGEEEKKRRSRTAWHDDKDDVNLKSTRAPTSWPDPLKHIQHRSNPSTSPSLPIDTADKRRVEIHK